MSTETIKTGHGPKLAAAPGSVFSLTPECLLGLPHAYREIARYVAWFSTDSSSVEPPNCPVTVVDACVVCGMSRSRTEPQSPNSGLSDK